MSVRSLFEINHDFWHKIDADFPETLQRYLASGDARTAADLERYGFRRVSQRHHADNYLIAPKTDGFA